ncbi:MAG: carbamoyltransferase HypF [Candidatus Thorarchaeota archaeon]|nr:carbamoyltransferase HypF [Candidatus Thorarchaeota archaeon]
MTHQAVIHVKGIVQGVGFRPFVYRLATSFALTGYVLNLGDAGVRIVVEGEKPLILQLIDKIKTKPPSISRVDSVIVEWKDVTGMFDRFFIEKSSIKKGKEVAPDIPPDIAICKSCISDMRDSSSRWYGYPFTSCAACGPRYSTITSLPYDRQNTTMIDFPLCNDCNTGYTNPLDRRYHAQTTACEKCGPLYQLVDSERNGSRKRNAIVLAAKLISEGAIIALQGIGGTHLVTKTTDVSPIELLRKRKGRLERPFAIMVRNIRTLREMLSPTREEIDLLQSWRRPVVLVRKYNHIENISTVIPQGSLDVISPSLDTVGVMLPYAPVHHLLFDLLKEPALVMTSANPTGVPMYIDSKTIISELNDVADYFLIHNRRIYQRVDDSVIKFVTQQTPVFIRRARGYVPDPIPLEGISSSLIIMGVGPEEKVTAAIVKAGRAYVTQHIGDIDQLENVHFLENSINHMMHLLDVQSLDKIACDLHPEFLTTEFAERLARDRDVPLIRVQHHHAHLASILADNGLAADTNITCITADGYGYGPDGTGWGGDVLYGNAQTYERVGGLKPVLYPGGDLSARFAVRALLGIMGEELEMDEVLGMAYGKRIAANVSLNEETYRILKDAWLRNLNNIESTSTGRFLDALSVALDVCYENSYDGECPMKLESIAARSGPKIKAMFLESEGIVELDTTESLKQILKYKKEGIHCDKLAFSAQWHLGHSLAKIACDNAEKNHVEFVAFSGGVALNRIISQSIARYVSNRNLKLLLHRNVPPGDGGVSLGQVLVASMN